MYPERSSKVLSHLRAGIRLLRTIFTRLYRVQRCDNSYSLDQPPDGDCGEGEHTSSFRLQTHTEDILGGLITQSSVDIGMHLWEDSSKKYSRRHYGREFNSVRSERDIIIARSERHQRICRRRDDRKFGQLKLSKLGFTQEICEHKPEPERSNIP